MDEAQMLGYVILALITIGSFIGVVMKFTQPINELRIVIQKLNDNIDAMKNDNTNRDKRIDKHGRQIEQIDNRVGKLETRMDLYHNKEG